MSSQRLPSQRLLDADVPDGTQLSGTRRTVLPWLLVAALSAASGALVVDRLRAPSANQPASTSVNDEGSVPALPGARAPRGVRRSIDATTDRDGNLNVLGVVEPAWPMPLSVAAEVSARVTHITVQAGDRIDGGAIVVELASDLLQTAQREAMARHAVATSELDAAKAEQAGPGLARLNEAVRLAEQQRNHLSEQYQAARVVSPDAVSPEALREIRNQLDLSEKRVDDARSAVDQLEKRIARDQRLAQEQLDAATAALAAAKWRVQALTVKAPVVPAGQSLAVLEVLVSPGDVVQPGTLLARVYDPRQLQVRVLVPARELSRISLGQERRMLPDAPAPAPGNTPPTPRTNRPSTNNSNSNDAVTARPANADANANANTNASANANANTSANSNTDRPAGNAPTPAQSGLVGGTACTLRPTSGGREDERDAVPVRVLPTADAELDAVTVLLRVIADSRQPLRPGAPVRVTFRTGR
ncbi:MAG: HlyD family secretion protein [Planctomycetota bacterium]